MSYKVQFVGLVCFYREHGTRLALLPDGRIPPAGIDPHYASIVVHPDMIENVSGWDDVEITDYGVYPLDPCEVIFEGADVPGLLDVSKHEHLPQLRQIDPDFEIDPQRAQTIAKVRISQGKLTAHLIPDGHAVVSQLEVEHGGPNVTITIRPDGQSVERTIRVKPAAEIAITNMARGVYRHETRRDGHFRIYEKLSVRPVRLKEPEGRVLLPELKSRNPLFAGRGPIGLYINCSNTGCC